MQVTIEYNAQLKRAAGTGRETVQLDHAYSITELLRQQCQLHGDDLRALMFQDDGTLHPSLLVFVGDEQVEMSQTESTPLRDGDVVTVLSPISGG